MARYSFECTNCGTEFDVDMPMSADHKAPLKEPCPSCFKIGTVFRLFNCSFSMNGVASGIHDVAKKKAGSDWEHVLKRIKKGSSTKNTMEI